MISLPLVPDNPRLSGLFPDAVVVYCYKKGIVYVSVKGNENLVPGARYWIFLNQNQSYLLYGQILNIYTLPVENGWYMIGSSTYPAQASVNTGNILVIYGYIAGVGYQRINETENLEPGNAYWILFKKIMDQAQLMVVSIGH